MNRKAGEKSARINGDEEKAAKKKSEKAAANITTLEKDFAKDVAEKKITAAESTNNGTEISVSRRGAEENTSSKKDEKALSYSVKKSSPQEELLQKPTIDSRKLTPTSMP